jgi:hypothetical protein
MSYMMFQQQCKSCDHKWNAAFGIVGMTVIAAPPEKCPACQSTEIEKVADKWEVDCYKCQTRHLWGECGSASSPQADGYSGPEGSAECKHCQREIHLCELSGKWFHDHSLLAFCFGMAVRQDGGERIESLRAEPA